MKFVIAMISIYISDIHVKQKSLIDSLIFCYSLLLLYLSACQSLLFHLNAVCLAEKQTNTNFIVFSFTQAGLDPTIYHTHGEHVNHYTTDAVNSKRTRINYNQILWKG
jgi:hypothetical protein